MHKDRKKVVNDVIKKATRKREKDIIVQTASRAEDIAIMTKKGKTFRVLASGKVIFEKIDFEAIRLEVEAEQKKEMDAVMAQAEKVLKADPELAKKVQAELGIVYTPASEKNRKTRRTLKAKK